MKKLIPVIVIGALAATALVANAFAAETTDTEKQFMARPAQMEEKGGMFMTEEAMAELEALAEEAGMSLEEYMATMMPEQTEKTERPEMMEKAEKSEDGERPEMMEKAEKSEDGERPEMMEDAPMMGGQASGGMNAQGGHK